MEPGLSCTLDMNHTSSVVVDETMAFKRKDSPAGERKEEREKARIILFTYLAIVLTIFFSTTTRRTIAVTFDFHTPMTRGESKRER